MSKVPLDDGDYTVDHTASVILIDRKGRFRATIAYRENHETALDKLRLIVSLWLEKRAKVFKNQINGLF